MKLSVVIPVYNVEPWIEACLVSVLTQSNAAEIQCIVVDDCGSDNSMAVAERIQSGHPNGRIIHIVKHIRNRGLSAARNTGTAVADGEYIFYLDGDDQFPADDTLKIMAEAAEIEYPDWVQGNFLRVPEATGAETVDSYHRPGLPFFNRAAIEQNFRKLNFTNATNKLIRLDFIRENELSFREGLIFEDSLWCMQAYEKVQSLVTVAPPTYRHNIRGGSIMQSAVTPQKIDSLICIVGSVCRLPQDINTQHSATYMGVYALKNLFFAPFRRRERREKFRELWQTGVARLAVDRAALPPFSRLLSRAFMLPGLVAWWYASLLVPCYRRFSKNRKR